MIELHYFFQVNTGLNLILDKPSFDLLKENPFFIVTPSTNSVCSAHVICYQKFWVNIPY